MVDRRIESKFARKFERPHTKEQNIEQKVVSLAEVAAHCHWDDCWIVIYDRVYDITTFLTQHPAGMEILLEHAGCDATFAFLSSGHSKTAIKMLSQFLIGTLPSEERLFSNDK